MLCQFEWIRALLSFLDVLLLGKIFYSWIQTCRHAFRQHHC